jgi:YVTN family beta-propeller protein
MPLAFLRCFVCSLSLFFLSPLAFATPATAYITNQGSDTVSVIDLESSRSVADIPVGKKPVGVAVSPQAKRVFITNVEDGSVSVIDTAQNKVIASRVLQNNTSLKSPSMARPLRIA